MTEQEFHKKRRMFFVIDGAAHVAEPGDTRMHREWLNELLDTTLAQPDADASARFPELTRGYFLDGRAVFYKGEDFSRYVNRDDVDVALAALDTLYGRDAIQELGFGARYDKESPWPQVAIVSRTQWDEFRKDSKKTGTP